jgi:hypothetical protein
MSQDRKVYLQLVGLDGNAFSLMGAFQSAARRQGFDNDYIKSVIDECQEGDYDHLLRTLMSHTTTDKKEAMRPEEREAADRAEELKKNDIEYSEEKGKGGGLYWGDCGLYQELQDELWKKLVPASGEADTPHGELVRMINRFYYDVYNNGLCNDKTEEAEYIIDHKSDFIKFGDKQMVELAISKLEDYLKEVEKIEHCDCDGGVRFEEVDCDDCYGSGKVDEYDDDDNEIEVECETCGGSGRVDEGEECWICQGDIDYSEPFCWSKSLDALCDAILLHAAAVEKEKEKVK